MPQRKQHEPDSHWIEHYDNDTLISRRLIGRSMTLAEAAQAVRLTVIRDETLPGRPHRATEDE